MEIENIFLIDLENALVDAWQREFEDCSCVQPLAEDYFSTNADALVSPANSFGIMDGGIDLAIRYEIGTHIEEIVQQNIRHHYHGELPVGAALIVETGHANWPNLIVAPTMRVPMDVSDSINAYLSFSAILNAVKSHNLTSPKNKIRSLICPGLCTGVGQMLPYDCAKQMRMAFNRFAIPARIPSPGDIYASQEKLTRNGV